MPDIVVWGEQVPVLEVEGASLVEHIPDDVLNAWLTEAGYDEPEDGEQTLVALNESGFDMPAAWTKVPNSRLIEAGIGPGYINSIVAVFQAKMVQRCGTAFVKRMQGTTKTDEQVAQELVKLKHVPQPPMATEKSGYGCSGERWRAYLTNMANWARTTASNLAQAVQQIHDDEKLDVTCPPYHVISEFLRCLVPVL